MVNGQQENKSLSHAEREEKRNKPKKQQKGPVCYALAGPRASAGPLDAWSGESLHLQVCQCAIGLVLTTAAESPTVSAPRCPMTDCGAVRVPYVDLRDGERVRRDRTTPLSPRLALRRVLVLAEGRQFREAAAVLSRLGPTGLAVVASELPLDILVESLPHSAQLLETLFSKLVASCQRPSITADPVIWQLVRLLASYEDPTLKSKVAKLAKTLVEWQPDFRRQLMSKKKALEQAVQGLGCHGLTADASGLTHLHVALKTELQRHVDAYKSALHRLDEFSTSNSKNPTDASHHRLLSLHYSDVQQRLIDNKTLLTLIDKPALQQLRPLVETLSARVQSDKEALFCVSQLKRLQPISDDKPVASLLMSYSRGCATLLELMQNDGSGSPCSSDGYHSETEPETEREADVIGRYGALYMQNRPRALEALDSLPELMHATQLKAKILFSVVVLAFRSCRNLREHKIHEMCSCLHVDVRSHAGITLRNDVIKCLGSTAESFPLQEVERQVRNMVCGTLKEYTCLENCTALCRYIRDVTRVSWMLVNQTPPYELDTDFTTPTQLQPDRHVRHHSSDRNCDIIRSYLWPALMINSNFVHKAVVITGL